MSNRPGERPDTRGTAAATEPATRGIAAATEPATNRPGNRPGERPDAPEPPPFWSRWHRIYLFVAGMLLAEAVGFWLLTRWAS